MDGPRYVASLQSEKDRSCYNDFFESEKLEETKQKADEASEKYNRSALVFDRKIHQIIHKKAVIVEKPVVKSVEKRPCKIKRKDVKSKTSKDAYFE